MLSIYVSVCLEAHAVPHGGSAFITNMIHVIQQQSLCEYIISNAIFDLDIVIENIQCQLEIKRMM